MQCRNTNERTVCILGSGETTCNHHTCTSNPSETCNHQIKNCTVVLQFVHMELCQLFPFGDHKFKLNIRIHNARRNKLSLQIVQINDWLSHSTTSGFFYNHPLNIHFSLMKCLYVYMQILIINVTVL